jgi:hypothetical protein
VEIRIAVNQFEYVHPCFFHQVDLQSESNPLTPITSLPNTPAVSSPSTARSSLEKAESELALRASVSPALGEEGDNLVTRYYPIKTFNGTTSNTIAFTEYNQIGDNAYATKNQAAQVTAGDQVRKTVIYVPSAVR